MMVTLVILMAFCMISMIKSQYNVILLLQVKMFQQPTVDLHSIESYRVRTVPRLINDLTLDWNETMHRPWLAISNQVDNTTKQQFNTAEHPPYMILLTNVGWNQPNQTNGLTFPRSIRERELYQGLVNHPYFHPTAWEEIRNGTMSIPANSSKINYYVFADVMNCPERNYPTYGGTLEENMDTLYNRSTDKEGKEIGNSHDPRGQYDFFTHPLLAHADKHGEQAKATLVVLNCRGLGPGGNGRTLNLPVSVAAISGHFSRMNIDKDQGLIAPAVTSIRLSRKEQDSIANCDADTDPSRRPFNVVYIGNFRSGSNSEFRKAHDVRGARGAYEQYHNPEEGFVIFEINIWKDETKTISIKGKNDTILYNVKNPSYKRLMRTTKFALVPRGDNKFSYRFTEALAAGAIPVFHGDDYMFPFRPEVVDWNRCALILPEKDAGNATMEIINDYLTNPGKTKEMCARRQYCYFEIYRKYIENSADTITGLVEGLEALARGERKPHAGFKCNNTSIENLECNPTRL